MNERIAELRLLARTIGLDDQQTAEMKRLAGTETPFVVPAPMGETSTGAAGKSQPVTLSDTTLRIAVEQLQKAVKWRDISLQSGNDRLRRAARSVMRHAALNSRTSYAGGLICAN